MKMYLAIALLSAATASAMDRPVVKEETKKIANQATVLNKMVFHTFQEWGYIDPEQREDGICEIGKTTFPDNRDLSQLLPILLCWQLPLDSLEGENMVIDLSNWVFSNAQFLADLVNASPRKRDGSIDYESLKEPLKKAFDQYCATLFTIGSPAGSCVLTKELVSFFPFFSAIHNFKPESFLNTATKDTCILFKKALTIIYNYCKLHWPDVSFEKIDELVGTGTHSENLEKKLKKDFIRLESILENIAELWEIGHYLNITPLCHVLLETLKMADCSLQNEFIAYLPKEHFPFILQLMGHSDFITNIVAQKLSLLRSKEKVPFNDAFIIECLDFFAQNIYQLKESQILLFFGLLDSEMKESFLDLLIKRHAIATSAHCVKIDLDEDACKADRYKEDEIYFFGSDGKIRSYYPSNRDRTGKADPFNPEYIGGTTSILPSTSISRYTQGNRLGDSWYMMGDKNGVVYICDLAISEHDQVRLKILPQSHWGAVTALCDNSTSLIAAYESGAVELFDLSSSTIDARYANKTKGLQVLVSNPVGLFKDYRTELEKGLTQTHAVPENEAKKQKLAARDKEAHCHLLIANDTYVVGAYKNGCLRVWKDKKIHHCLPVGEITQMCLLAEDTAAVGCKEGTVYIIDLMNGKTKKSFPIKSPFYRQQVTALTPFGEDKRFLAVGYKNSRVCIWDLVDAKLKKTIEKVTSDTIVGFSTPKPATLELFWSDGLVERFFIPECASISELMKMLEKQSLF